MTKLRSVVIAFILVTVLFPNLKASAVAIDYQGQKAWKKTIPLDKQTLWFCGKKKLAAFFSPLAMARPTTTCGLEILNEEARRLESLQQQGAPVPRILKKGKDYLILSHEGINLEKAINQAPNAQKFPLILKAVEALTRLHALGAIHGRAMVKDMVLKPDHTIAFIDMAESPLSHMSLNQAKARDWLMFLFSSLPMCDTPAMQKSLVEKVKNILAHPGEEQVLQEFNRAISWGKALLPALQPLAPHLGKDGQRLLLLLGGLIK